MHAAALRVFGGRPPVGIKVVVEGEEEAGGHLEDLVAREAALFAADAFVVADMGDLEVGEPVLTTTLRGNVVVDVTVTALDHAVHSGEFGGPVPDALMALVRILDGLVDDEGAPAIDGLDAFPWLGVDYPEDELRRSSGLLEGVELIGRGSIATRLWSQPAVTIIGLGAPSLAESSNALCPQATARVSVRTAPGQDPAAALRAITTHVTAHAPWGVHVEVSDLGASPAFMAPSGGPAWAAARRALADAFGAPCGEVGSGGSIPLMAALAAAAPEAEFLLFGAEDMAAARIHGGDESVDPVELERMIVAEALTLEYLAGNWE
jgi:cysteinylglycine-S-conjugate dipeptidase